MATYLERLRRFGSVGYPTIEGDDDAPLVIAQKKIREVAASVHTKIAEVEEDGRWSAQGKGQELRKLATETLRGLANVEAGPLTSARKRRSALEAQLHAAIQPEGADPVAVQLRAREIRDHARSLDHAGLQSLIYSAVRAADREVVAALLDAPPSLRLVDEAQAKEARRLLARTFDAKAAQELDDLTGGLQAVEAELGALREDLSQLGQPPQTTEQRLREGVGAQPEAAPAA